MKLSSEKSEQSEKVHKALKPWKKIPIPYKKVPFMKKRQERSFKAE